MADPFGPAVLATARTAWNSAQVHAVGEVPATPTTPYEVLSVSSGSAENYRLSAQHGSRTYRIAIQAVGSTATEVDAVVEKAEAAFLDVSLTVAGFDCSRCQPESSSPLIRDPDGGVLLSKTITYTFTAFPE